MSSGVYLLTVLSAGLLLGVRHAFDADHVVAVSTLLSRTTSIKTAVRCGIIWGLGHTFTLFLVGVVVLLFRRALSPGLAGWFESAVGVMLIVLGLGAVLHVVRERLHAHNHPPVECRKNHASVRFFLVGTVHGLAGSATLMLLVLSSVETFFVGVLYILIFGLGSVGGMLFCSGLVAFPLSFALTRNALRHGIQLAAGSISIVMGVQIVGQHLPV